MKKGLGVGAFEVGENNVAVNSDTHDTVPSSQHCILIHFNWTNFVTDLSANNKTAVAVTFVFLPGSKFN